MTYIHDLCVKIGDVATNAEYILSELDKLYTLANEKQRTAMNAVYAKYKTKNKKADKWHRDVFNEYAYAYIHCLQSDNGNLDNIVDVLSTGHPITVEQDRMIYDNEIERLGRHQRYIQK